MTQRSRAYCLIRPLPVYRHEAFCDGLKARGYDVRRQRPGEVRPGDLLVIWNRYGELAQLADQFEVRGGTVLVAENGYLGAGGGTPKFDVTGGVQPGHYYALAVGGHNGQGRWPDRPRGPWIEQSEAYGARWRALRVPQCGWRLNGAHILVCPNRSFGRPGHIMPAGWAEDVARRLRASTKREVRVRPHPGNDRPARELERDLEGAHAVAVWSSSAGVHALVRGIQVLCEAPAWILKGAALARLASIDQHWGGERVPHLERLAWAQWTVEEIASGFAFRHLLPAAQQGEVQATA